MDDYPWVHLVASVCLHARLTILKQTSIKQQWDGNVKRHYSATKHGTRVSNTCVRNCLLLVHTRNRLTTVANLP